jgi:hypothetical protein
MGYDSSDMELVSTEMSWNFPGKTEKNFKSSQSLWLMHATLPTFKLGSSQVEVYNNKAT